MKTKSLKNVLISVLIALVLALGVTAAFLPGVKTGAEANPEALQLKEEYLVGTEITLPDMTFSVGGSEVKAVKTVYYPDGRTFRADKITAGRKGIILTSIPQIPPMAIRRKPKVFTPIKICMRPPA